MKGMEISQNSVVTTIKFDEVKKGWSQWVCLMSDIHHDSVAGNEKKYKKDLDKALERDALIFKFGDLFDLMQTRNDPRRDPESLKDQYNTASYVDAVIMEYEDFLEPYKNNIALLGYGNHETAIIKNINTDPLQRLAHGLNRSGANVQVGGFGGWVDFRFWAGKTFTRSMYYHHSGGGGNAPVTKGVIATNRQGVWLDADIVVNGHNHKYYHTVTKRERLNSHGQISHNIIDFVRTPGYKQKLVDKKYGYAPERHPAPAVNGCVWLLLEYVSSPADIKVTVVPDVE